MRLSGGARLHARGGGALRLCALSSRKPRATAALRPARLLCLFALPVRSNAADEAYATNVAAAQGRRRPGRWLDSPEMLEGASDDKSGVARASASYTRIAVADTDACVRLHATFSHQRSLACFDGRCVLVAGGQGRRPVCRRPLQTARYLDAAADAAGPLLVATRLKGCRHARIGMSCSVGRSVLGGQHCWAVVHGLQCWAVVHGLHVSVGRSLRIFFKHKLSKLCAPERAQSRSCHQF